VHTFAREVKKKQLPNSAYLKQFQDIFERIKRDYVQDPEKQKNDQLCLKLKEC
jgi:hypothetical protein